MMSFWVTFVAFWVLVASFFAGDGPTLGGWTQYAPLSAIGSVGGPARVSAWFFGQLRFAFSAWASC